MKKSSFAFLILSLIATNAIAQKTDWGKHDLKGKVKSLTIVRSDLDSTVPDYQIDTLAFRFDSLGYCVEEYRKFTGGKVTADRVTCTYDDSHNLLSFYDDCYYQDGEKGHHIIQSRLYSYDCRGRILSVRNVRVYEDENHTVTQQGPMVSYQYLHDGKTVVERKTDLESFKCLYKGVKCYDDNGNLVSEEDKYSNGKRIKYYYYDELGNLIKTVQKNKNRCGFKEKRETQSSCRSIEEYVYEYDDNGNKTKEMYSMFSKKGSLLLKSITVFMYDELGRIIIEKSEDGHSIVYSYNSFGKTTEAHTQRNGHNLRRISFYDVYDNEVSFEEYEEEELRESRKSEYEYDEMGNYILRRDTREVKPVTYVTKTISRRFIEYY